VFERRDRLPAEWGQLSEDQIRVQFESCYPFHPSTLTVFQRKWQALAQFQQTRTTLAMLGMWISCANREGYGSARREPLLTLGSAPLGDREFLSAVLRQMGEQRLQAAIQADISAPSGLPATPSRQSGAAQAGQPPSHAETLDEEQGDLPVRGTQTGSLGKTSLHRRVATTLFFESCGVLWLTCESGGSLRLGCEELMAWQAVAEDANRGLLGELESDDLKRIQRELSGAKSQIEERV
jgi:hypothetical protein